MLPSSWQSTTAYINVSQCITDIAEVEFDDTKGVYWGGTDNTMAKRKRTKEQTTI
jgi:hypothetical protein